MLQDSLDNYSFPWWFPVFFVYLIILYEYFVYNYYFLFNVFMEHPYCNMLIFPIFNFCFSMLIISYYRSIRESAGFVPSHINDIFTNLEEIKEKAAEEIKYKAELRKKKLLSKTMESETLKNYPEPKKDEMPFNISQDSFCFKCNKVKPPRAHHCKECKRCILRMDHHCVWVGNCVGKANHKYFVLFLFYATICLSIVFFHIIHNWFFDNFSVKKQLNGNQTLNVTICAASSIAMALAIGYLFCFQIWCLKKNITTVEFHIEQMLTPMNPFRKNQFVENAKEIFGNEIKKWFFPVEPFRKNYSNELDLNDLKL